jgi:hypothetical protein
MLRESMDEMQHDPVITTLELLHKDAKSSVTTEQRQRLVLAYASSLITRKAKLLYLNTLLAQRPAPIFGFIDQVCCDRVAPVITPSAVLAIDGKHAVTSSIAGPAAFDNKHAVKGSVDGPIALFGGA